MDSDNQLPIVLEQKSSLDINKINESPFDIAFNNLTKTLKEMETLINSLPISTETETTISSLKEISTYGNWNENPILPNGTIRTLPYYEKDRNGMDSFFICKMQRII